MFTLRIISTLVILLLTHLSVYAVETKSVVVTIKPLHSLVSGVMGETGEAELLLKGTASPHNFQFKPSQMRKVQQAKIIFYIDNQIETFIESTLGSLSKATKPIAVAQKSSIKLLPHRQNKDWEKENDEEGDHHAHNHGSQDMHIWLSPLNAIRIVKTITKELSAVYPQNRDTYKANARKMVAKIQTLDQQLKQQLAPVKNTPFIVFHDAYQYFEKSYRLKAVGSIVVRPNRALSPKRVSEIQQKLHTHQVQCIFSEPQFSDRIINTIIADKPIKRSILDPLGAKLKAGDALYFELLQNLATSIKQCLQ